jgi:hypothetical protein
LWGLFHQLAKDLSLVPVPLVIGMLFGCQQFFDDLRLAYLFDQLFFFVVVRVFLQMILGNFFGDLIIVCVLVLIFGSCG